GPARRQDFNSSLPADKRGQGRSAQSLKPALPLARLQSLPHRYRLADASHFAKAELGTVECAADKPSRLLVEQYRTRFSYRLQTKSEVGRFADDPVLQRTAHPGQITHDNEARRHAHADRQPLPPNAQSAHPPAPRQ